MKTPKSKDYSDFYSERWNVAVRKKNYTEALDSGIKGYLVAKDLGNETHKMAFLGLIRFAINELIDKPSSKVHKEAEQGQRCSFCGRKEGEANLMAGPSATICRICVGNIQKYFAKHK